MDRHECEKVCGVYARACIPVALHIHEYRQLHLCSYGPMCVCSHGIIIMDIYEWVCEHMWFCMSTAASSWGGYVCVCVYWYIQL